MAGPDVPPPDPRSNAANAPRALIVDDDPGFLLGLAELVRREGFAVATAGSLKQAREVIAANPPDILLVDLRLPDGSGLDLLAGLEPSQAPELVLITGDASVETAVEALRRGAIDYLTKPVDFARIKMALANVTRTLEMMPRRFLKELRCRRARRMREGPY
jgi:DNA-binding NtrC family response regulator